MSMMMMMNQTIDEISNSRTATSRKMRASVGRVDNSYTADNEDAVSVSSPTDGNAPSASATVSSDDWLIPTQPKLIPARPSRSVEPQLIRMTNVRIIIIHTATKRSNLPLKLADNNNTTKYTGLSKPLYHSCINQSICSQHTSYRNGIKSAIRINKLHLSIDQTLRHII